MFAVLWLKFKTYTISTSVPGLFLFSFIISKFISSKQLLLNFHFYWTISSTGLYVSINYSPASTEISIHFHLNSQCPFQSAYFWLCSVFRHRKCYLILNTLPLLGAIQVSQFIIKQKVTPRGRTLQKT